MLAGAGGASVPMTAPGTAGRTLAVASGFAGAESIGSSEQPAFREPRTMQGATDSALAGEPPGRRGDLEGGLLHSAARARASLDDGPCDLNRYCRKIEDVGFWNARDYASQRRHDDWKKWGLVERKPHSCSKLNIAAVRSR